MGCIPHGNETFSDVVSRLPGRSILTTPYRQMRCRRILTPMPQTINKTYEVQIIGGIFSTRENDDQSMESFQDLDIPRQNIQVVVKIDSEMAEEAYTCAVLRAIRNGNILVAVHNITDAVSIIEAPVYPA